MTRFRTARAVDNKDMSQQGERPAAHEDDWWRRLYDEDARDTGTSDAADSLDDRFDSASDAVGPGGRGGSDGGAGAPSEAETAVSEPGTVELPRPVREGAVRERAPWEPPAATVRAPGAPPAARRSRAPSPPRRFPWVLRPCPARLRSCCRPRWSGVLRSIRSRLRSRLRLLCLRRRCRPRLRLPPLRRRCRRCPGGRSPRSPSPRRHPSPRPPHLSHLAKHLAHPPPPSRRHRRPNADPVPSRAR